MDYQIFEIMLLFAFYCILGWLTEVFGFALSGKGFQNRGLCYGPYLPAYGIGALTVVFGTGYITEQFDLADLPEPVLPFVAGIVVSLILGLLSKGIINGLSGSRIVALRWYQPLLFGLGAVILVLHLNTLLIAYIRFMSPWVHLIFLLAFYLKFLSDLVEGISRLMDFKKKVHVSQIIE